MIQIFIKIVLTLVFIVVFIFFVWKIWTNEIDIIQWFKKPSEIIPVKEKMQPPTITPSLMISGLKYEPGVEIDGIVWKKEFEIHNLNIQNSSESIEVYDVRIEIELPGAIISYKMFENNGSQDISFSQRKLPAGIGQKGKNVMRENVEYYINQLSISAAKIFPKANFSVTILLSHIVKDHGGTIGIKYRYMLPDGKSTSKSSVYPIEYLSNDSNQLRINHEKPITGTYDGNFLFVPKKQLNFSPSGKVSQKE
jgi:hypothetical protein